VQQRRYGRPVSIGLVKVFDPLCSVKADLIVTRLELVGKLRDLALTLEAVDHQTDDVENSETCLSSITFQEAIPEPPKDARRLIPMATKTLDERAVLHVLGLDKTCVTGLEFAGRVEADDDSGTWLAELTSRSSKDPT
jgi:hypothetical protein